MYYWKKIIVVLAVFILIPRMAHSQRFSLLADIGVIKSQVDGDKIQGFYYNGYLFGIGSNYAFNEKHFLAIKTSFQQLGSNRKNLFQPRLEDGFQVELDFSTIALECSYKFDPPSRRFFMGAGVLRHQIVNLDYEIVDNIVKDEDKILIDSELLSSSYFSFKFYYGIKLLKRTSLSLAFETAFTDIMKSNLDELRTLKPYLLAATFSYEIIAPKIDSNGRRPGTKARQPR